MGVVGRFRRVKVPYIQPPLATNKQPIDYMDLLFAAWNAQAAASGRPNTVRWVT